MSILIVVLIVLLVVVAAHSASCMCNEHDTKRLYKQVCVEVDDWRKTCDVIANTRDSLRSEVDMLRGAISVIAEQRDSIREEHTQLKKALMEFAQDFGREATNPNQESC